MVSYTPACTKAMTVICSVCLFAFFQCRDLCEVHVKQSKLMAMAHLMVVWMSTSELS